MSVSKKTLSELFSNNLRTETIFHIATQALHVELPEHLVKLFDENFVDICDALSISPPEDIELPKLFNHLQTR